MRATRAWWGILALMALLGLEASRARAQEPEKIPPVPPSDIWDRFPKPRPRSEASPSGPEVTTIQAWSADGRFLAYRRDTEIGRGTLYAVPLFIAVVSARDRTEKRLDEGGYNDWLRTHPDAEVNWSDPQSPVERAQAVVEGEGEWVGIQWPRWEVKGKGGSQVRCSIRRDGQVLESHVFHVPPGAIKSTVDLLWSPTGRRIAWIFQSQAVDGGKRPAGADPEPHVKGFNEVVIDRTVGPRIEIAGEKTLGPEAFDRVADAIEKAGYAPTGQRVAKGGAKTVVYAVKRWTDDAVKIAAAVPGGAVVKPMAAPRNGFEVVVELGRTAGAGQGGKP